MVDIKQKLLNLRSKITKRHIIVLLVLLIFLSPLFLLIISDRLVEASAKGQHSAKVEEVPQKKVALILGCSPRTRSGLRNLYFEHRMEAAAVLWEHDKVEYFLVSGDNFHNSYNEPRYMLQSLIALGIPEDRIVLDYAGFRTLDSVIRAKEVFGESDLIVVSQAFHNKRAIFLAKTKGVQLYGFDAKGVAPFTENRAFSRESLARAKALLDVSILNTQPRFLGESISIGELKEREVE